MKMKSLAEKYGTPLFWKKRVWILETALLKIGNDVSVFQTLPIAIFLIRRYPHPSDLLTVAANAGGNTDTIGLLCGAYLGAARGIDALPPDLLAGLEDRQRIELLGQRLHSVYQQKLGQI